MTNQEEIERITEARDSIRNKCVSLGISTEDENITELADDVNKIELYTPTMPTSNSGGSN